MGHINERCLTKRHTQALHKMNTNYGKTKRRNTSKRDLLACNGGNGSVGPDESLIWAQLGVGPTNGTENALFKQSLIELMKLWQVAKVGKE